MKDIFIIRTFNFLFSHLSHADAIPAPARMFAWPEERSFSLSPSVGAVSCGAASAGAGERDARRAEEHGRREEAGAAGGRVWRAAGGDTPPRHSPPTPRSYRWGQDGGTWIQWKDLTITNDHIHLLETTLKSAKWILKLWLGSVLPGDQQSWS